MELSTFGSLLAFAIETEERAARFYLEASDNPDCAAVKETLLAFAQQNDRRRKQLVETRQEHVTEMVLEPITDLHRSDYEIENVSPSGMDCAEVLSKAVGVEEQTQRFYSDAAVKGRDLLAGVARSFRRLAGEKQSRLQELESLVSS